MNSNTRNPSLCPVLFSGILYFALISPLACNLRGIAAPLADGGNSVEAMDISFRSQIKPLLTRYCDSCHSGTSPEAKLDTSVFDDTGTIESAWDSWQAIVSRVHESEMPPVDSDLIPTSEERELLTRWTQRFRRVQSESHRGDPGPVSTRRLSNAEFNNTVRDLTGVDINPTSSFPVDAANVAGFDNSAESLTFSPSLVTKYLDAARMVAEHMVLAPDGIRFAPHPVVTDTDRDKYCVQRIVDFYSKQPTAFRDYLVACWRLRHLEQNSAELDANQSIAQIANRHQLSPKYLRTLWETLREIDRAEPKNKVGPLASIRKRWDSLPLDESKIDDVRMECDQLSDWIVAFRSKLSPPFANLKGPGVSDGSQSLVLWKNRQMASNRRKCNEEAFGNAKESLLAPEDLEVWVNGTEEERQSIIDAYQAFCSVFPDAFYIAERGRSHIDAKDAKREAKGRLLSAGFHSMMGFFRDDQPLYELILSDEQQSELNRLWNELDFITLAPMRQYSGFIWYERAESSFINEDVFNFVRAEDRSARSAEMIQRFADVYLEKVRRKKGSPIVVEAIEFYFKDMNRQIRELEQQLQQSQSIQIKSLIQFAERAFRRPLADADKVRIEEFYQHALAEPNADHRSAMEDTLISILVSPSHLYRWDLLSRSGEPQPLQDIELASRLSYFLWASKPDEMLLRRAEKRELASDDALRSEMHRMLADNRSRGMVREFLGNWLDFRRFDAHNGVDRNEFPMFDAQLRQSMADEPIEFMMELLGRNGKLTELLDSNHVVIDRALAKHYGLSERLATGTSHWQRVEGVEDVQRGGLVSMAVFLTQNSPGLRTSPVKRGYWVVRKLLGEKIPPPPPNVPELPASEHQLGDLTLRELLAKHREHPSCASCHQRFDAYGLLLEGFDPVGRPRTKDLGGRIVPTDATLPNGQNAVGLTGLKSYLIEQRDEDFRRHFCQSLLSFALSRSPIISDDLLVDEMLKQLKQNDDQILTAFDVIIQSPQFRNKRGAVAGQQANTR